jgi:DNA-binding response OmpR family regulator
VPTNLKPEAPRRALIVEDDLSLRAMLATILSVNGFEAAFAGSVAKGIRSLDAGPELVILDLKLPDGLGTTVLREIRVRNLPATVAVLTGMSDMDVLSQIVQLRADKVFLKPFGIAEFKLWLGQLGERDAAADRIRSAMLG